MTQTALDEFVRRVRCSVDQFSVKLDHAVYGFAHSFPTKFAEVVQDPRYIAYCKEQVRKDIEDAQAALDEGEFVSLEEIKGEVGLEVIH